MCDVNKFDPLESSPNMIYLLRSIGEYVDSMELGEEISLEIESDAKLSIKIYVMHIIENLRKKEFQNKECDFLDWVKRNSPNGENKLKCNEIETYRNPWNEAIEYGREQILNELYENIGKIK